MAKKTSRLMILVLGGSVLVIALAVVASRRLTRPRPLLPASPEERALRAATPTDIRCTALHYGALLKGAAATYKVPEPSIEALRQPLKGGSEFRGARLLKGRRDVLETAHLRIETSIAKLSASFDGTQGFRADHLVLSITNKSAVPVAYRVVTQAARPERCSSKAPIPHNAIALRAGEKVRRTECLFADKQKLMITQVDVYELTELGHRYVSRLQPVRGGPFDLRVSGAHDRGDGPGCRSFPWRDLDGGADIWQAVIDFHARHDCDEYTMPPDYRPWTQPGALPVCTAAQAAPQGT